jgi:hypothetical protein
LPHAKAKFLKQGICQEFSVKFLTGPIEAGRIDSRRGSPMAAKAQRLDRAARILAAEGQRHPASAQRATICSSNA